MANGAASRCGADADLYGSHGAEKTWQVLDKSLRDRRYERSDL